MKKTSASLDANGERSADAIGEAVSQKLLADARQIIDTARANAVRSVDFNRVMMYWNLGRRVFEEEQHGKDRAEYGARIIRGLAERLEPEYGSGFGIRQLEQSRRFYRFYPIAHTLYAQLNWSQYKLLISIEDAQKREYYQLEAVSHCWTKRELERQIHSQLWERLCLSNDKEAILAVARKERIPETPQEIIKDPMRLEFLGLEKKAKYYESDLEQAIYVNYYDRVEKTAGENKTIGILLCRNKNDSLVKMTLPEDNKTILAAEYKLRLPSGEQLLAEVKRAEEEFEAAQDETDAMARISGGEK